jgi:bla regulator protein BlaR1
MERKDGLRITHYWGVTIGQLAATLLNGGGRPVQDKTGLSGKYDFTISMPVPDDTPSGTQQGGASDPQSLAFSAAEQLGLKLEPAKGEVETLVIDHVERPSEN